METKLVRVPFEVGMAKRIHSGECEGRIVTNDDRSVRIVCWDYKEIMGERILALVQSKQSRENIFAFDNKGRNDVNEHLSPLWLEIPEYMTFKDGDIATLGWKKEDGIYCEWITILKEIDVDNFSIFTYDYVTLCLKSDKDNHFLLEFDCKSDAADWVRKSTEEEKQRLIEALKASDEQQAKDCLKRFFGIEEKPKYEFKPFDKVLVRQCTEDKWEAMIFSNYTDEIHKYRCCGMNYMYCIPYNDQTAHLLGTTKDYNG